MRAGFPDDVPCVPGRCNDLEPVAFEDTDEALAKDRVVLTHDHPGGGRPIHGDNYTISPSRDLLAAGGSGIIAGDRRAFDLS